MASARAVYSGIGYAEARLCDGTRVGIAVALAIGSANLLLLLLALALVVRCARSHRPCYRCMQALAPRSLRLLERCGCGPTSEDVETWGELRPAGEKGAA